MDNHRVKLIVSLMRRLAVEVPLIQVPIDSCICTHLLTIKINEWKWWHWLTLKTYGCLTQMPQSHPLTCFQLPSSTFMLFPRRCYCYCYCQLFTYFDLSFHKKSWNLQPLWSVHKQQWTPFNLLSSHISTIRRSISTNLSSMLIAIVFFLINQNWIKWIYSLPHSPCLNIWKMSKMCS